MEDHTPPFVKTYWAFVGLSFAGFLFAFAPDRGATYAQAQLELEHLAELRFGLDDVYDYVRSSSDATQAVSTPRAIRDALERVNITVDASVFGNEEYLFVEEGALGLGEKVPDVVRLLADDQPYVIRVPNRDDLRRELETFSQTSNLPTRLDSLMVLCNAAGDRCSFRFLFPTDAPKSSPYEMQFYTRADRVELSDRSVYGLIRSQDRFFEGEEIRLPAVRAVLPELYDLSIAEAVRTASEREATQSGELDVLGVSVRGRTVVLVLPAVLLVAALFLLAMAREFDLAKGVLPRVLASTPLFFSSSLGRALGWASVVILPLATVLMLLVRFFDATIRTWIALVCLAGLAITLWLFAAAVVRLYGRIHAAGSVKGTDLRVPDDV